MITENVVFTSCGGDWKNPYKNEHPNPPKDFIHCHYATFKWFCDGDSKWSFDVTIWKKSNEKDYYAIVDVSVKTNDPNGNGWEICTGKLTRCEATKKSVIETIKKNSPVIGNVVFNERT